MNRDVPRRAICAVLAGVLALPLAPARALDLYARAIGDPYAYPPEPAPRTPDPSAPGAPAISAPEAHALPGLGSEEPAAPSATPGGGWSWGRVLLGIAVVGAMAALASKGGGGEVTVNSSGSAPPPSGAGDTGSGGGSIGTGPLPPVLDPDGDDDRKGKKK